MKVLCTIDGVDFLQLPDGSIEFIADADIDADGAYRAYHPDDHSGLDSLANAKDKAGRWCGIVCINGEPVIQDGNDPAPGYYVSPTSYQRRKFHVADPLAYVDASTVPFGVVSPIIRRCVRSIVLGCRMRITNLRTGQSVEAGVMDIGPRNKVGEISIAAAEAIGVPSSARTGGESERIIKYQLWPGVAAQIAGVTYELQAA